MTMHWEEIWIDEQWQLFLCLEDLPQGTALDSFQNGDGRIEADTLSHNELNHRYLEKWYSKHLGT